MRFVTSESFKDISAGGNIEAVSLKNATPIYNSTTRNSTFKDYGYLDLGLIRNVNNSITATKDNVNNTVTIKFKIVLEDNVYVEHLANYSVDIGMRSSEQTVWVSQMLFTANISADRRPRVKITTFSNGSDSLVQGCVFKKYHLIY